MQGIKIQGQMGFFAEWVNGTNPEKWKADGKIDWIKKLGPEWVRPLWLSADPIFILGVHCNGSVWALCALQIMRRSSQCPLCMKSHDHLLLTESRCFCRYGWGRCTTSYCVRATGTRATWW